MNLTWDQDDSERTKVTRRKFTKQDLLEMDFKSYLASDESSVESQDEAIDKYKSLLQGSDSEQDKEDENEEMEITFIPGLSQKAVDLLEKKKEMDNRKNETVFEAQLRKQKEKKKERKKKKEDDVDSDDLLVDPNEEERVDIEQDPFFQLDENFVDEPQESLEPTMKSKKGKKRSLKDDNTSTSRQELELLVMDEQDSKHFDIKSVIKSEKLAKIKRKKRKQEAIHGDVQDDFTLNLNDSRFTNVLQDHQFAIDPMNPQFKKTKAMERILEMRRENVSSTSEIKHESTKLKTPNLSHLVSSIKSKSVGKLKSRRS